MILPELETEVQVTNNLCSTIGYLGPTKKISNKHLIVSGRLDYGKSCVITGYLNG